MSPHYHRKPERSSGRLRSSKPRPASSTLWKALTSIDMNSSRLSDHSLAFGTSVNRLRHRRRHRCRTPPEPEPKPKPVINAEVEFFKFRTSAQGRLAFALGNSYTGDTSKNHDYAIKRFIRFANNCGIEESKALPCDVDMLCLWIADGIGRTGIGTATSNIAALSAWHRNRDIPFEIPPKMKTIKRAIKLHWPEEKQQKPTRPPISPRMIHLLATAWSEGNPCEKCALAIALSAFMGQMRLGELLPASQNKIHRERLPSRGKWSLKTESKGASSIFLPWTKTTGKAGASIILPSQSNPIDPTLAICHHFIASPLSDSSLICEFIENDTTKTLDKETFMEMCNNIWSTEGFPRITGHSFRIGGTTSLLLAGIDTQIVKGMGRWSSDAFKLYWRKVETLFQKHASNIEWMDFEI
jgi:hypothetical protein